MPQEKQYCTKCGDRWTDHKSGVCWQCRNINMDKRDKINRGDIKNEDDSTNRPYRNCADYTYPRFHNRASNRFLEK